MRKYFCKKYQVWLTRRDIEEVHKDRCFGVRKGRHKGKRCRMLIEI